MRGRRTEAPRMPGTRLSLVIPAYNEAATVERAVAEAETALGRLFDDFEILIVDDGSRDATAAIVHGVRKAFAHTRLLRHSRNRGYGAALRTGFEAARFELIAFTDADCQFDLNDLGPMAKLAAKMPIVAGWRRNRQDARRRRFFSWVYNRLARALLGTRVRDCDCALKVFQREALARILPQSRGFFVNAEMLTRARLLGIDLVEVPVAHRPRLDGESKVSLREIPRTLRMMFGFWWSHLVLGGRSEEAPAVVLQRIAFRRPGSREHARLDIPAADADESPRALTGPAHRVRD